MRNIDQIISALYLAKSDNREKMLSDLIVNVIYNVGGAMPIDLILLYIKDTFHLEAIEYEIQNCLDQLVEEDKLTQKDGRYNLLDIAKGEIHKSQLSSDGIGTKRFNSFKEILANIDDFELNDEEVEELWNVFNEYLLECFLVFGKKAINIFLPFKVDELNGDNDITSSAFEKLKSEKLISIFKLLTVEYPIKLNEAELRYLTKLANRAEKFYSLGITQEDYDKIKRLQIKDLIVLVDTNILYSILEFRKHPDDCAINEILRIANEKKIDLRLVYIPKTYKELQKARNYLEKVIPRENFKISHIRALINSDKLDPFAKKYYEGKLINSETPHPSQKIRYASDVLKTKSIIIYNNGFKELKENKEYLNERIKDYYDFQKYYNKICDEKGYDHSLYKDDKKIEHDVFLREAIKKLRVKLGNEDEMKFVCLTLDRSLIHFDHYIQRQNYNKDTGRVINPNFILPSIFIKRIRPFIPIETDDYRKAFISSITAPNLEKENYEESLVVQKSMSFFKNLGIDDEEIIMNCIKRELFFEEFTKHEKESTTEDFIKTEVAIEIERIKEEKKLSEAEVQTQKQKVINIVSDSEAEKQKLLNEKERLNTNFETKESKLKESIRNKDEKIDKLESRLDILEKSHQDSLDENTKIRKKITFEKSMDDWNANRKDFIYDKWKIQRKELWKSFGYFHYVSLITILPVGIGVFLKANKNIIEYIESIGINQWYVWGLLIIVLLIEVLGRSYIFDKSKVKNGYKWGLALINRRNRDKIKSNLCNSFENDFLKENTKPKLND